MIDNKTKEEVNTFNTWLDELMVNGVNWDKPRPKLTVSRLLEIQNSKSTSDTEKRLAEACVKILKD